MARPCSIATLASRAHKGADASSTDLTPTPEHSKPTQLLMCLLACANAGQAAEARAVLPAPCCSAYREAAADFEPPQPPMGPGTAPKAPRAAFGGAQGRCCPKDTSAGSCRPLRCHIIQCRRFRMCVVHLHLCCNSADACSLGDAMLPCYISTSCAPADSVDPACLTSPGAS